MPAPNRVLIVPRWGGSPDDDWYRWLEGRLAAEAPGVETATLALPTPDEPALQDWVAGVLDALGNEEDALARTVLVGHSVGCQAILRALAELPRGVQVAAVLCVAGWFAIDEPWDAILPWLETPVDLDGARDSAGRWRVLLSDDDPFTADAVANRAAWEDAVGAEVAVVPGVGHFNAAVQPAVLAAILALLDG